MQGVNSETDGNLLVRELLKESRIFGGRLLYLFITMVRSLGSDTIGKSRFFILLLRLESTAASASIAN
jgi:hypothetical protein